MRLRFLPAVLAPLLLSVTAFSEDAASGCGGDDPKAIIARAAANDEVNDKRVHDYTYTEREEQHKLGPHGEVKSSESTTSETMVLYGESVTRLVARNDKPLSEKEAAKEEERIQKLMKKREKESDSDREKRLAEEEKEREKGRKFVSEITDAFNFEMLPQEEMSSRAAYVIDAQPRAGFKPQSSEGKYLPKFKFRVWVDRAECQWVMLDATVLDTISWGWFVARLNRGSHLLLEQTRVNDEVWLPQRQEFKLDARVVLLKKFDMDVTTTFSGYHKFRTESRIIPASVAPAGDPPSPVAQPANPPPQ